MGSPFALPRIEANGEKYVVVTTNILIVSRETTKIRKRQTYIRDRQILYCAHTSKFSDQQWLLLICELCYHKLPQATPPPPP